VAFDQAFDAKAKALVARMKRSQNGADKVLKDGVVDIAERAVARLRRTTPRSKINRPHVADGWVFEVLTSPQGGVRVRVFNAEPRANAVIKVSTGGVTSLLRILEFGSRPHRITPKKPGGTLAFAARGGDAVETEEVFHPGTRPYAMLAQARTQAAVEMKILIDNIRAKILIGRTVPP